MSELPPLSAANTPTDEPQAIRPNEECIVCGATAWERHFDILLKCRHCDYVRADLDLDNPVINDLYDETYFSGGEYGDYLGDRDVHVRNFRRRYDMLIRHAGRPKSVFEIGCAYGLWLELLTRENIPACGMDICEEPVKYAAESLHQNAKFGDFLTADIPAGAHDVYCMWDTIEHLSHPEQFVQKVYDLLPPGGWFFATTGDIGAWMARFRGKKWRMIHPPTHLHYFSGATAEKMLRRIGFDNVSIESVSVYRNLRSVIGSLIALRKGPMKTLAGIANAVTPGWVQDNLGAWINLGDIMLMSSQKPHHAKNNN
ncbi:MAG: class I SAM-dependent methyltransferase [Planctomycetales bacterium]